MVLDGGEPTTAGPQVGKLPFEAGYVVLARLQQPADAASD